MTVVEFFAPGIPKPQGSKRAFVVKGRPVLTESAGEPLKDWRTSVAYAASTAMAGANLIQTPVHVTLTFTLVKPRSRSKHRPLPDSAPDLSKLVRAVEDAMTGIVWRDDAQVVGIQAAKVYGEQPGLHATITAIAAEEAAA